MILEITFVTIMTLMGTLAQDPFTADSYLSGLATFRPSFNPLNLFDGPSSISHAMTIPTTTKRPTLERMLYYSHYAAAVYCHYDLDNLNCRSCQTFKGNVAKYKVFSNSFHNTLALVTLSHTRQEIVITFRGTYNIWNSALDFTLWNVNADEGNPIKVHRGFYIALMSLYEDIVKCVNSERTLYSNYKIVIVGHSLGGTMATLAEFFFLFNNQFPGVNYEVYTYGEPRSGNKYYVDFLNNQPSVTTARIVNRNDFATHIIPTSILGTDILYDFYFHTQSEYWITDNGSAYCNNSFYEDPDCSDSVGLLVSLVDHETYFGENFLYCLATQPHTYFALPFNTFTPVGTVPPIPGFIPDIAGGLSDVLLDVIDPILGR